MGGLRDGKSPAAFAAYGRQGPRTVSEPKIRKPPTCRSHGAQMRFKPLCAACSMQDYGFDRCDGHHTKSISGPEPPRWCAGRPYAFAMLSIQNFGGGAHVAEARQRVTAHGPARMLQGRLPPHRDRTAWLGG